MILNFKKMKNEMELEWEFISPVIQSNNSIENKKISVEEILSQKNKSYCKKIISYDDINLSNIQEKEEKVNYENIKGQGILIDEEKDKKEGDKNWKEGIYERKKDGSEEKKSDFSKNDGSLNLDYICEIKAFIANNEKDFKSNFPNFNEKFIPFKNDESFNYEEKIFSINENSKISNLPVTFYPKNSGNQTPKNLEIKDKNESLSISSSKNNLNRIQIKDTIKLIDNEKLNKQEPKEMYHSRIFSSIIKNEKSKDNDYEDSHSVEAQNLLPPSLSTNINDEINDNTNFYQYRNKRAKSIIESPRFENI
jgi:hypothetical protein